MFDTGAALHVCPLWYGAEFPLFTGPSQMTVTTADGTDIRVHGLRAVYFTFEAKDGQEVAIGITFTVCDVTEAIVPFSKLLRTGVCSCEFTAKQQRLQIG